MTNAILTDMFLFCQKLLDKEQEQIDARKEQERLKQLQRAKMQQLKSELKAAVFEKIGVIASKADNEMKENEMEYNVEFGDIKQIYNGLKFTSLNGEMKTDMVVVSCNKDVLNEENGMYVDTQSVMVQINETYVFGLKTSTIERILKQAGDTCLKSGKMTINIKFRVDKMIRAARLEEFKATQQPHEQVQEEPNVTITRKKQAKTRRRKSKTTEAEMKADIDRDDGSNNAILETAGADESSDVAIETVDKMEDGDSDDVKYLDNFEQEMKELTFEFDEIGNGLEVKKSERVEVEADKKDEPVSWLELLYSTVVESLSTADLITDGLVLIQFFENSHLWWASWMVLLILAPYMVSYVSLDSLFQKRVQKFVSQMEAENINDNDNHNNISKWRLKWIVFTFVVFLLLTPISLLYFVVIDIVFMIYVLISSFLYCISCSKIDIKDVLDDFVFSRF